jgi:flagellar motor switch protein FliM
MNDVTGMINVCLPYVVMETAIHRLGQGTTYRRTPGVSAEVMRTALEESAASAPVEVKVDLGRVDLTLQEILGLSVGDVLRLHAPCESGAEALVQGRPLMNGSPGRFRGNLAFRVESIHRAGDEEGGDPA